MVERNDLDTFRPPLTPEVVKDPAYNRKYIAVREVEIAKGLELENLLGIRDSMEQAYLLLPPWQSGHFDYIYLPVRHPKSYRTKLMVRDGDGTQFWKPGDREGY